MRFVRSAVALPALVALLVAGCSPDRVTAPALRAPPPPGVAPVMATAQYEGGAPPARTFGPDTRRIGIFTGVGTTRPGLTCAPGTAPAAQVCTGYLASFDSTRLDVTVKTPSGTGPFPLVVLLHGYGGSKNSDGEYDARLLEHGFTVLRYSARGFGKSWGQVNLADRDVELVDLRRLIGQVVDDPRLLASPDVAVMGASYGGGQSWLAALRPTWTSPAGTTITLRTIVPIVPWTDLLYALRPNGTPRNSIDVPGFWKLSYLEGLFLGGFRRDAERPYPNYPDYFFLWNAYILATEPNNLPPIGTRIVDAMAGYRSIWWQSAFWRDVAARTGTGTQIPVFDLQGWTDDLFPPHEALRMYFALRKIDPDYPIALYLGDIGHPRAPNKPEEVDYALDLILSWLDYYLNGTGTPPSGVIAAITRPRTTPFSAGDVVSAPTYEELADDLVETDFPAGPHPQALTFNPANPSGVFFDPFVMLGSESLDPNPPPPPPDVVPGDVATYRIRVGDIPGGENGLLIAGEAVVRLQLQTLALRAQYDIRLIAESATGGSDLVTRGTYTYDAAASGTPPGSLDLTITAYGNLREVGVDDILRLEITNVDSPYIMQSRVPSATVVNGVRLTMPVLRNRAVPTVAVSP